MIRKFVKVLSITFISLISIVILAFIVSPIINNVLLNNFAKQLKEYPLPKKTELIEHESVCGKLNGNGNGMNFLSSMLVKSDLTLEEIEAYYSKAVLKPTVNKNYSVAIETMSANGYKLETQYLEHKDICFETLKNKKDSTGYYVIMIYDSGYWGGFDIRGN